MDMKGKIDFGKDLYSQVAGLSELGLSALADAVNQERDRRRQLRIAVLLAGLRVGMEVRIKAEHETGKTRGKTFIIDKINPKNLRCTEVVPEGVRGSNARPVQWTITATLVEPVK